MDSSPFASLSQALTARATRRTALGGLGAGCLSAGLLASLGRSDACATATVAVAQGDAPAWRIAGDAMEACRCNVTCPCNFGSDPTFAPCGSMVGWSIQDGQYGDVSLGGLNLVAYLQLPGNIFAGDWTLGFYLDERATAEQSEALQAIFSGQAGGWPAALGPMVGTPLPFKQAPISYALQDGDVRVEIPGVLEVETERVSNPVPGQPPYDLKVANLVVPFYTGEVDVRRSTILKLTDPDLSYEFSGRSALIGRFEYTGP